MKSIRPLANTGLEDEQRVRVQLLMFAAPTWHCSREMARTKWSQKASASRERTGPEKEPKIPLLSKELLRRDLRVVKNCVGLRPDAEMASDREFPPRK